MSQSADQPPSEAPPAAEAPHTEAWFDHAAGTIGWQCFTCGAEASPFIGIAEAEAAADVHVEEAHTRG